MMHRTLFSALMVLYVLMSGPRSNAQSKEEKKYAERSREVNEEIMGVVDTTFSNNTVPAAYSNSSAVILAKKIDFFSDLKSNVRYSLFYGRDITKAVRYSLTIREKIKIQDKNALEEYSQFSFSKIRNQSGFFKTLAYTFTGIRIMKPDGTVKTIDIDAELVNTLSEPEKEQYKLAIPGLQVGDILDMYVRVEKESSSEEITDPLDILISGAYPIVKYSFNTKVRNSFAVIYTSSNGGPDLAQTRDDDFIYLKAFFTNIDKQNDDLWVYERREQPVIKINIIPGGTNETNSYKNYQPKKSEVVKGLPKEWIDAALIARLAYAGKVSNDPRILLLKEYIKRQAKENRLDPANFDSLINCIYYYGRFLYLYKYISDKNIQVGTARNEAGTDYRFYSFLMGALTAYHIDFEILFTVPRNSGTIYDVVSFSELAFLIRAKGKDPHYLVPPHMYTLANSFPAIFEGQEALVFKSNSLRPGYRSTIERLPFTRSSFNQLQENLVISVNKTNPQLLNINRTRSIRGNPAYDNQTTLSLYEEYNDSERIELGEPLFNTQVTNDLGKKKAPQLLKEYDKAFAKARKNRMENARKELESTFETKAITLDTIKILQTGNRHTRPDFIFDEQFTLGGLVKTAGSNYIIDIGNIINGQVRVKTDQRIRKYGIYMPYARSYVYNVSFNIPAGFTAEGVNNLNKNISNETGSFTANATLENNQLILKISKVYNHYYEKAANWEKMLEFLDAAYNFSQEKIMLKKK